MASATAKKATTAKPAAEKKPKEKPKAGKVIERLALMFGNVFLAEVAVKPSNKTKSTKVFLGPKPMDKPTATSVATATAASTTASATSDAEDETSGDASPAAVAATSQAETAAVELCLHVHEGRSSKQVYDIAPEQLAEYQKFVQAFNATKGLHILHIYPASAAATFVHKATYFLEPNAEVGDSLKAYHALHAYLSGNYKCALAHHIGKEGFYPVAIFAVDDGLVMWELPLANLSYGIDDSIDPVWKSVDVPTSEGELFAAALDDISRVRMNPKDLCDPTTTRLLEIRDHIRSEDEMPVASKVNDFPNFGTAVAALKKRARKPRSDS